MGGCTLECLPVRHQCFIRIRRFCACELFRPAFCALIDGNGKVILKHRPVPLLGVDEDQGWHYIALEYVDGQSMQKWLDELGRMQAKSLERQGADPYAGRRLASLFLDAGLGYGGSCFPKDVKALAYMAAEKGRHPQLLHAVMEINNDRRPMVVHRLKEMLGDLRGKTVGLLGLVVASCQFVGRRFQDSIECAAERGVDEKVRAQHAVIVDGLIVAAVLQ